MSGGIMIVGEAWGKEEAEKLLPFVGPTGRFLSVLLKAVGIDRRKCYLTNVFNLQPKPTNSITNLCGTKPEGIPKMPALSSGKYVHKKYAPELERLLEEVEKYQPTLIIALGGTATWALCHQPKISRIRGAPLKSITGHKVLPTYHPSAVLRDYKLRPVIFADLKKAVREAAYPEIRRPVREFWLEPTLHDLERFDRYVREAKEISVDVETWNRQITCVGIAPSPSRALVVPFVCKSQRDGNYWRTLEEELAAWGWIRHWLTCGIPIHGQNYLYDISYFWRTVGIPCPSFEDDTMLLHHAHQPEMEKSLGFLGSIYSDEPSWKFMRKTGTIKKED